MRGRFVSIWFRHLATDWFSLRQPHLKNIPFVLRAPSRGRMIVVAANAIAEQKGIVTGMPLADARAIVPDLEALDDKPNVAEKLLKRLAEWCIRFTPIVAVDSPDGLLLDTTGCSHLWGGEQQYLADILKRLAARGYDVQAAMADTIGLAWGIARFRKKSFIITDHKHIEALMSLPPEALRLEAEIVERLHKLGLHQVRQFINMPRSSLRRRFGRTLLTRIDMALGLELEMLQPVHPVEPYQEHLPCLEPILMAKGIEIALVQLLEALCIRLQQEQKGLRKAIFEGYRVDGKVERLEIGTNSPSYSVKHIFKLFENKLADIEPALGIELFVLRVPTVEDYTPAQGKMWEASGTLEDARLCELIDRLTNRFGAQAIHRYLPNEHHWPERSLRLASPLHEKTPFAWQVDKPRPTCLLPTPQVIDVSAPIPDYPPMLFRYKGKLHQIVKADGPERIEQEWWIQQGQHRDYYQVEDENGQRFWLFRLGHYHDESFKWFIHGFFA